MIEQKIESILENGNSMYVLSAIIVAVIVIAFTAWVVKQGSKPDDKPS